MARNGETPVRDALISVVAAMIIAGVVMVLVAYKAYWALVFPFVGVLTFIIVLYYHPSRFYKRVVWAFIGLISLFLVVPGFRASGILGENSAFILFVDSVGTGGFLGLCGICGIAMIVNALMDYSKSRKKVVREQEKETAGKTIKRGLAKAEHPDRSPTVGYAEKVEIHYGEKERPIKEEKTEEIKKPEKKKVEALWPKVSLPPLGGVKVSEPFAGREEELKELGDAMNKDKGVVAVVGMAGQGKSCLVGEWYKRGARPPEGVGMFWRKVYEAGYTFDRFLDDFYLYLTGEEIDRRRFSSVEERAILVEGVFRERPCWIVLDGVERWLKRWAAEPDAGAEDLTIDDRAGQEEVLDKFLKDTAWWENGSRLLLTTRAVPSGLDENPPIMIGKERERERRLEDLRPEEAIELLEKLGDSGDKEIMREAAGAYGNHPYAVHVLGILIHDLYGGDVSRWEEVSPLKEKKIDDIFEKIIEHRAEDLELLELVACSVGPAPVEMLAELLGEDEAVVRRRLAELARWQMVEFKGKGAEQHAVVRRFMTERIGEKGTKELRRGIARWWSERDVPARPVRIDEVQPLLKAVEHLIEAKDPDAATEIFLSKPSADSYYTVNGWLRAFGYLDEDIRICGEAIRAYIKLVEKEGRRELRNHLAMCYTGRGLALADQYRLDEAIDDHGKAIEIYGELVEKEGRRELRNDLAGYYNNRGLAFWSQGNLSDAITDYGQAIEIYKGLIENENRRELRNDLAMCYNNRGNALSDQGKLSNAIADLGKAIEIYGELVEKEGRRELRNVLASCYNNRGVAYSDQGKLSDAIADYGKAIEITKELVEKENRRELRNYLAGYYNNRGLAFWSQGNLSDAITDLGQAIEIYKGLVEKEGRCELRSDLERSLFNRAVAQSERDEWRKSRADIEKGAGLLRGLIEEGQRHLIGSFLKTAGFRCAFAKELEDVREAAEWANEGMRWFLEEAEAKRLNEELLRGATGFAVMVQPNVKLLAKNGLDEEMVERFMKAIGGEGRGEK